MGTRAMVLKEIGRSYECFYRHTDGYPSGLGAELIEALRSPFIRSWDDLVECCRLEKENRIVAKPEDAFLKVQGDLEYIYVVKENPTSLTIYRTSNPYDYGDDGLPSFVWRIWASYKQYFPAPNDVVKEMARIQQTASIFLQGLRQYHKALNGRS